MNFILRRLAQEFDENGYGSKCIRLINHSCAMNDGMLDEGVPEVVVLAAMAPFVLLFMLTFLMILAVQYTIRYIYLVLLVVVIGYVVLAIFWMGITT